MPAARKMEEPGFEPSPEDEEAFRLELEALGDSECSDTESESGDGGAERYLLKNGGESSDDDEAGRSHLQPSGRLQRPEQPQDPVR